jgi:Fur family ferric uptake transcriptional regulator
MMKDYSVCNENHCYLEGCFVARKTEEEERTWRGKFKSQGYKVTKAREAILNILDTTDDHLSAKDIFGKINNDYPDIGLTTVYRTLDILSSMGLILKLDFGDGQARYELAHDVEGTNHHHHLVCTICNKVINYSDFIDEEVELLHRTEKGLSRKYRFKITNHIIQFYGVCEQCRNMGK